jgi:mono/diheme cytochrome c family protein
MVKLLRGAGYVLGVLLLVVILALAWVWIASSMTLNARVVPQPERLVTPTAAQLADGPRQLRILGCVSCHGEGLRGKLFFDEPNVAQLYAPNLTLVAAHADDQQLARAIRQGVGHDGRSLFAMPSSQYARLTDAEVASLISAIRVQPKGGEQTSPVTIGLLGRVGIVSGKFKPQPALVEEYSQSMPAVLGPQFAKGRHLAMTNCAECHGSSFGGGEPKPGLKAPDLSIVGAYDLPAFTKLMRTGVPASGKKLELMDGVARSDFSHFNDEEIAAIHSYLVERAQRAP